LLSVQRTSASYVEVLDHVLDKGIVIDAWVCVSLAGIKLITVEARVVVASIETYLKHADSVAHVAPISPPGIEPADPSRPQRREQRGISIPARGFSRKPIGTARVE
jgi:gas vesicle structural protein